MPALIQVCLVILTIALLVIAWMTVRMVIRVTTATEGLTQLTHAARESVVKFDLVTQEARALVASIREGVPPALRLVGRLDAVSQRVADLSSTILEEFELPVFAAAAVARGVRSGANHFLKRMVNRLIHRHSPIPGGFDHD